MLRGEKHAIEKPTAINTTIQTAIHNRFDIDVLDAASGDVKQKAVGYNVVCTGLWTRLFGNATYNNYIFYGGGSGTPSASDTSLFSYIGYAEPSESNDVYSFDSSGGVYSLRRKIQLSPETAVGETLTEVGIAYGTGQSTLCTHAMLQDMNGNPVSIVKSATDIINIYATVFVHFPAGGMFGTNDIFLVNLNQTFYSSVVVYNPFLKFLVGRKYDIIDWGATVPKFARMYPNTGIGNVRGSYYYEQDDNKSTSSTSFNADNKTITLTFSRIPVAAYNYPSGIGSVYLTAGSSEAYGHIYANCTFQILVGHTMLPGTQITGEAIATGDGVTTDFATSFPMVSNASIKVNGVVDPNVIVDTNVPGNNNDFGMHMNSIESNGQYGFFDMLSSYNLLKGVSYQTRIFENPYYATIGLLKFLIYHDDRQTTDTNTITSIEASNDLSNWATAATIVNYVWTVDSQYQNYRYWRVRYGNTSDSASAEKTIRILSTASPNNIHFATPPAAGAVITADYFTKMLAKDTNHVFDLVVTIQLGEYSEV